MHVGTQQFSITERALECLARHGVANKNDGGLLRR